MVLEVQASIPYFNALPKDCATNVWHFTQDVGPATELEILGLINAIAGFYEAVYAYDDSFASYGDPAHVHYKVYDLDDAPPRATRVDLVSPITVSQESVSLLPPEVAVCASIRGVGVSGTPLASQRGRVYLGVIGNGAVNSGAPDRFPTVDGGFRSGVTGACESLVANIEAGTGGFHWVIYSRKLGTNYPVVAGHCDDAFDTQRRRGHDPVVRATWP